MKYITKLNFFVLVSFYLINVFQISCMEPVGSSKGNITPVKINRSSKNRTSLIKDDPLFGSIAKISRVVPAKHSKKLKRLTKSAIQKVSKDQVRSRSESVPVPNFFQSNPSKMPENETPRSKLPSPDNIGTVQPGKWDYLNSVGLGDEMKTVTKELRDEPAKNYSTTPNESPVVGRNLLFQTIANGLNILKLPRTLEIPDAKVNTGVRFSAMRKPVLNVKPPKVQNSSYRNASGHISNNEKNKRKKAATHEFSAIDEKEYEKILLEDASDLPLVSKGRSSSGFGSTTPSLMQVLAVPDTGGWDLTTFSPFIPPTFNHGFIPSNGSPNFPFRNDINTLESSPTIPTVRKPRGPPQKDGEYAIPPITSTTGPAEVVSKGYHTISDTTTPGPKLIWYNHNQTPEDTFYPNTNDFLMPPEEASIEVLTDLSLQQNHGNSPGKHTSLAPSSADPGVSYNENGTRNIRIRSRYRNNQNPLFSDNGKPPPPLQHAASSIHDGIRDYDGYSGNGGSSRRPNNGHHESRQYGPDPHPEIPQYQEINGKPFDGTGSYGAYNEVDHGHNYHDSYHNKHEISQFQSSSGNNYKGGTSRPPNSYNGNYKHTEPNSDYDTNRKPAAKDASPGWGWNHGDGHGADEGYGHGWKGDSKDFFDKAKDYFKNTDISKAQKWFEISLGVLAFLAFGGYLVMLLYQVFTISSGTPLGNFVGKSFEDAGEMFDVFFSKGPIGQAYMDELETIVKRAMANVKRIWMTNSFPPRKVSRLKGEADAK